jgi:hypothetical protein
MLAAVKPIEGRRISAEGAATMLRAGLLAVSANPAILKKLPPGGADGSRVAMTAIVHAVMATVFSDDADAATQWHLARESVAVSLVTIALEVLAERGIDPAAILALHAALDELTEGAASVDGFKERLETLLDA